MSEKGRVEYQWHLEWVPMGLMHVSTHAQRERNEARVRRLLSHFDPDLLGTLVLSRHSDTHYNIVDGQHRHAAAREWFGEGWEIQQLQCRVYLGLSEAEEASLFDLLNDVLAVKTYDKYRVRVRAGRPVEAEVERLVQAESLRTGKGGGEGEIGAVGTLVNIYQRADGETLSRALRIVRDSYGETGLKGPVIDGVARVCQRYNSVLDDARAVERLSSAMGGLSGLLNKAETMRRQMGAAKSQCIAAAIVDTLNAGKGGKKLAAWWAE